MTPDEAAGLARTITESWPGRGASRDAWEARLESLDFDAALDTVARLVDTEPDPPSIARFIAAYRAGLAPAIRYLHEDCALCGGTGWEEITVQRPNYPHPTTGVVPCRCSRGRANEGAHLRAVEHNETELRRSKPLAAAATGRTVADVLRGAVNQ